MLNTVVVNYAGILFSFLSFSPESHLIPPRFNKNSTQHLKVSYNADVGPVKKHFAKISRITP